MKLSPYSQQWKNLYEEEAVRIKDILGDLEKVINKIKLSGHKLKKVIFLGDMKHSFTYEKSERFDFVMIIYFLKIYVK